MEPQEFIDLFKGELSHCVYRLVNASGDVVYVGSTSSPSIRMYGHTRSDKVFSTVEFSVYPSFDDLAKNEAMQIIKYSPEHNTTIPTTQDFITLKRAQDLMVADVRRIVRNLPRMFCRGKTSYLSVSDFEALRAKLISTGLDSVVGMAENNLLITKHKKVIK